MIAGGGLSGGISSYIAGGSFWQGVRQGLITSGLNHAAHAGARMLSKEYPPPNYKGSYWKDGDGEFFKDFDTSSEFATVYEMKSRVHGDGMYIEFNGPIIGKNKTLSKVEKLSTGIGINMSTKEAGFKYAQKYGELSSGVSKYYRYTKIAGKIFGITSAATSWAEYSQNRTTGNLIQAIANTGLAFARVNPILGLYIGVLDVTGASDYIYDSIGNLIDN